MAAAPAWAQVVPGPAARWGILADLAGSAFRSSYVGGGATEQSVIFFEWEIPGKLLSFTRVSQGLRQARGRRRPQGRRELIFYRMEADGRILGTWENRPIEVEIAPDGSAVSRYEINGRAYRTELVRTGSASFRTTITAGGGTGVRESVQISREEALRLAARFYPAEYAPRSSPPRDRRQQGGTPGDASARRIALVLGISAYAPLPPLANPVNDARAVAASLSTAGFDVDLRLDTDLAEMRAAVERLNSRIGQSRGVTDALLYFAGHGVQWNGANYLLPRDGEVGAGAELNERAVSADFLLDQIDRAAARTAILILDACRNVPDALAERQVNSGLAHILAPSGSYIAYSTAPGMVALDGSGQHSPFAAALMTELSRPRLPIETVFKNVRRTVLQSTDGRQTPWDSSSLIEPFYFRA